MLSNISAGVTTFLIPTSYSPCYTCTRNVGPCIQLRRQDIFCRDSNDLSTSWHIVLFPLYHIGSTRDHLAFLRPVVSCKPRNCRRQCSSRLKWKVFDIRSIQSQHVPDEIIPMKMTNIRLNMLSSWCINVMQGVWYAWLEVFRNFFSSFPTFLHKSDRHGSCA